jgi:hypothetical protein
MKTSHRIAALLALGAVAAIAVPALSQRSEPPIARYTVDAGTMSGMAAMAGGGGNPLAMLRGGGGQAMHELFLRLGSSRAPTGEPKGDHFMPANAGLGKSVPLVTPQREPAEPTGYPGQMPKGKLSLYWGCGEHAPKGQPVVIDFSKLAKGQVPPGLFATVTVADDWRVTTANSKTYGDWPNSKERKTLTGNSSILGAHKVTSTYAPEIDFTLADDFMPPLQPRTSDMASGATNLTWGALPKATGYYAWVIATNPDKGSDLDMVWWTSSSTQQFGGFLGDWLSPGTVKKLVDAKTVMPPSQTSCAIPAEVKQAGGPMLMTQLYAYGPQADFAYPPRPSDPKVVWKPEWIARVRFRANAMVMAGMPDMGSLMGNSRGNDDGDDSRSTQQQPQQPQGKPKCPGGLRGIGLRAAGQCQ